MSAQDVVDVLTEEHHAIDRGIEGFSAQVGRGAVDPSTLTELLTTLRRHIYLEEEFLFPPMARMGLVMPIGVMIREHGQLWLDMDTLDQAARAAESRPDEQARVVSLCADLLGLLDQHNSKEEPIVYPQTATMLDPSELDELTAAMQEPGMPDGWVCQSAR